MAVGYFGEGHVANGGTTGGAAVVPVPASTPAGALMLLAVGISSTTIVVTPPAGWTEVALPTNVITTEAQLRVYQRVAASEPASYTVTFSAAVRYSCSITVYTAAEVGPVNSFADGTAGLTHASGNVTPDLSGTWIWTSWATRTGAAVGFGGWTPQAGDVERVDQIGSNSSVNVGFATDDSNAPVSLVSQNRVVSTAENRITIAAIVCLRPTGISSHPVNPTGIPSEEDLGTTVVTHTRLISSGDIPSAEDLGTTVVTHTTMITSGDIPSAEALGTTTLVHTRLLVSGDLAQGETMGTTELVDGDQVVSGDIPSEENLGTTTLVHTRLLVSGDIPSAEDLGDATLIHTRLIVSGDIPSGEALGVTLLTSPSTHLIAPTGIPSAEAMGVTTIRKAVTTVGCEPWPIDTTCLPAAWGTDPEAFPPDAVASIAVAQDILDRLTAGVFGLCTVKIRPCRQRCHGSATVGRVDNLGVGWYPLLDGGKVYNIACGCSGPCGCGPLCEVTLPGRVRDVIEVLVDGVPLSPDAYEVNMWRDLVRTDGGCWPDCQDFSKPDTQPGTWSVLYSRGTPLSPAGKRALAVLATELWKGRCGDASCRLPARVTSVTRDGVTYDIADTMEIISEDRFGIVEIDAFLNAVNPGKARSRMAAWSPDMPAYRRRTS